MGSLLPWHIKQSTWPVKATSGGFGPFFFGDFRYIFFWSFLNGLRFIRFPPGSISPSPFFGRGKGGESPKYINATRWGIHHFPQQPRGGRKHPNIHQPDPQRFSTGCVKTPLEPVRFSASGFPGIQQRDQLDAKGAVTDDHAWLGWENGGKMSMPVV